MIHLQRTIYIDVLFCVNFIIDYIILLTVRRFMNIRTGRLRLLLGAAVGGISSFVILLPALPSGLSLIFSLAFACFVVGAAFAPLSARLFLKTSGAFFLISFGYSGIMLAVLMLFSPEALVVRNTSVYIDISPTVLIITTVICYVIMRTVLRIIGSRDKAGTRCTLIISDCGKTAECEALIDTGSSLCEPFSGIPVIVAAEDVLPETRDKKYRLVPFSSVGGDGLLKAYRPERISIVKEGEKRSIDAFIAVFAGELKSGVKAVIPACAVS